MKTDDIWPALYGMALYAIVIQHAKDLGFMAFQLNRILEGRCPKCGYLYSHPVALLTGQSC